LCRISALCQFTIAHASFVAFDHSSILRKVNPLMVSLTVQKLPRKSKPIGRYAFLCFLTTIFSAYFGTTMVLVTFHATRLEPSVGEFDAAKPMYRHLLKPKDFNRSAKIRISQPFVHTQNITKAIEGSNKKGSHRGIMQRKMNARKSKSIETDGILRAYLEEINQDDWEIKPLPIRNPKPLSVISYPRLNNCSRLPELFPIDDFPDEDPFLPWIHDVFPTHDGKFIQFVAQNKRRCRTGKKPIDEAVLQHMQPQAALFQHVAVKRVPLEGEIRYQLCSHDQADGDGLSTRFICRFKPSGEETLSIYNVDYDYAAWRKKHRKTFTLEGRDTKDIFTSQLLFQCPVPDHLQGVVRSGESVKDDWATLFVDIVPIRTPPRYGRPDVYFPPWYKDLSQAYSWNVTKEWGNHILPSTELSGRWENIPICKPSLMTYKPKYGNQIEKAYDRKKPTHPTKIHQLAVCTWASTGYFTRGARFGVNDGQRRMREWIHFGSVVGVDHFYIYDNSGAFGSMTLQPIADMFPDEVTIIPWPASVCNNNMNNVDSPGERSSQYAAESSCRLRFGPYMNWLGAYDIDEYLVPMGSYDSLLPLLDTLEKEGKQIISFKSWRAWPRMQLIEPPEKKHSGRCSHSRKCFDVIVPENRTILQTYNCDRQKGPKKDVMPAEKQLYRPDYVKLHFVHYSTITTLSAMNKTEFKKATSSTWHRAMSNDFNARFSDEVQEGTMLHAKAMATQDTGGWEESCKGGFGTCRIGNPYPDDALLNNITKDNGGWLYNCFVNNKIEKYYLPILEARMKQTEEIWSLLNNQR